MIQVIKKPILVSLVFTLVAAASSCSLIESSESPQGGSKVTSPRKKSGEKREYPPAPKALADAEIKSLDGEDFKISDLKGKVVLINLWATWCGPCLEEMPHLVKLQEKYRDDGFVVIGLNTDEESEAQVKTFVEKQGLNYKIGWSTREVVEEFMKISKMPGIPQSLLLNRDGEMTGMFRGGGPDVIASMVEAVDKRMAE